MATTCPIGFDVDQLHRSVCATYERVAHSPGSGFHFRTGRQYAVETLGYSRQELDALPDACTASFAGVGNPHGVGGYRSGATVLDHACGSGMDLLIAARRVGWTGRAIGVDLTPAMRGVAAAAAAQAGLADVFEDLPVEDESVDYVVSNGVVNLAPDKPRVFAEIERVLRPGGRLHLADVVLSRELATSARQSADLWAACIGGAVMPHELVELAAGAGLADGRIVERFDCFRGTTIEKKFHGSIDVYAVSFVATKPGGPVAPPLTT
jgi:arsenite methyltransferase